VAAARKRPQKRAAPRAAAGQPPVATLASRLFANLCDGEFHSGEELAGSLGVTRSAVWKAANALRELGTPMDAIRNRGYRLLTPPSEPLVASRIRDALSRQVRDRVERLDVAWSIGSTNTELVGRPNPAQGRSEILLAEFQTAGRGRRGRSWLAPPGGAVCLSLSWTFPDMPRDAGALGLAIGVCVLRTLESLGIEDARLKWPNDVLVQDKKLSGVLIELRAESDGPACVVIGIGLNVALGVELLDGIAKTGLPAIDITSIAKRAVSRNEIAAGLIDCCIRGLVEFEQEGLRPFIEEWRGADALRGRLVSVQLGSENVRGIARSIDLGGALIVETPQGLRKFYSGEVTVRPAD